MVKSLCVVVSKVLDCDIIVREFELQSRYYIRFWIDILRKGMNPLVPTLNSTTIVLGGVLVV